METTRAYYMSHILLRNEIYSNWNEFNDNLKQGPENMKKYLSNMWNSIDSKYFKQGVSIKDIDRIVTENDFDITTREINGIRVFFFIFPDPSSYDAQAKVCALALCKDYPRYITMEIWTEKETNQHYTIGEWAIKDNNFMHMNLGKLPRNTIECFVSYISNILENE